MPLWFIVTLQKTFLLQSLLMVCGEAVRQSIITLNVYSNVSWWLLLNYISGNVKYLIKQATFNSISWLSKYFSLVNWLKWLFWHLLTPLSSNVSFLNDVRSSKVTSMLSCIFAWFSSDVLLRFTVPAKTSVQETYNTVMLSCNNICLNSQYASLRFIWTF